MPKGDSKRREELLIKLVLLEAAGEGKRRHRRMPVGRLRCVEEEGVGPLTISSRGHICKCVY